MGADNPIRLTLHRIADCCIMADDAVERGDNEALQHALTIAEAHLAAIRSALQDQPSD